MTEFGIWMDGTPSDSIVTNAIPPSKAHVKEDALEYYGGYLVAESVPPEFKDLIKASPYMLEALEVFPLLGADETAEHYTVRVGTWFGSFGRAAIAKAKGEQS